MEIAGRATDAGTFQTCIRQSDYGSSHRQIPENVNARALESLIPSVVTQEFANMKRLIFAHGGVARRCHSPAMAAPP